MEIIILENGQSRLKISDMTGGNWRPPKVDCGVQYALFLIPAEGLRAKFWKKSDAKGHSYYLTLEKMNSCQSFLILYKVKSPIRLSVSVNKMDASLCRAVLWEIYRNMTRSNAFSDYKTYIYFHIFFYPNATVWW